jgi:hypothetical protein
VAKSHLRLNVHQNVRRTVSSSLRELRSSLARKGPRGATGPNASLVDCEQDTHLRDDARSSSILYNDRSCLGGVTTIHGGQNDRLAIPPFPRSSAFLRTLHADVSIN